MGPKFADIGPTFAEVGPIWSSIGQLWAALRAPRRRPLQGLRCRKVKSEAEPERLATGALVEGLALQGDRLNYRKVAGAGPETGWVTTKLKTKDPAWRSRGQVVYPFGGSSWPGMLMWNIACRFNTASHSRH